MAPKSLLHRLLLGDVYGWSHPIHGAVVHFPLTFFMTAFVIDSTGLFYPRTVQRFLPSGLSVGGLFESSRWMHILGVVTSLPAVVSGLAEYLAMNSKSRAITTVWLHIAANSLVSMISLWTVYSRWNMPTFAPEPRHAFAGLLAFATAGYSGYLGAALVYKYGTGVQRQGTGLETKRKQNKGEDVAPQAGVYGGVSGGKEL